MFQDLNPLDRSTATLEILIMLLVAFILGFLIAWWLRKSKTTTIDNSAQLADLENSNASLKSKINSFESEQQSWQSKNSQLQSDLDACLSAKAEPVAPVAEAAPISVSSGSISDSDRANAERLGFAAVSESDKDDLTRISGVGSFIEKKLNALGIYSFAQISEFTPDTINRVTDAIEFFPGRIQRDDWVRQAGTLK